MLYIYIDAVDEGELGDNLWGLSSLLCLLGRGRDPSAPKSHNVNRYVTSPENAEYEAFRILNYLEFTE